MSEGDLMLGVMNQLRCCMFTWEGYSSLGLGNVSFVANDGIPSCLCGLICCCGALSVGRRSFIFKFNNEVVGEVRLNSPEETVQVEFHQELDLKIKALYVFGSFALVSTYYTFISIYSSLNTIGTYFYFIRIDTYSCF